jgi:hypothetical protein
MFFLTVCQSFIPFLPTFRLTFSSIYDVADFASPYQGFAQQRPVLAKYGEVLAGLGVSLEGRAGKRETLELL